MLGSMELSDGTPYIFIDGALEMEDVTEEGLKVSFTELSWKRASQNMDQLFSKKDPYRAGLYVEVPERT
ncbi:hypothetical protein [Lacrimispora xylanisolvens]|uniref:hypothetical protein n=1 Tax=Lacrimispora xylanisolvens TaxID=384636 RepID=UPI0032E7FE16